MPSGDDYTPFIHDHRPVEKTSVGQAERFDYRRSMAVMTTATDVLAAGWGPGAWWPIFPLFWVLFWGLVIFAVFRFRRGRGPWHQARSGEGVLSERYARGEITEEEYRERLNVLRNSAS
jgi:putative membrane protein